MQHVDGQAIHLITLEVPLVVRVYGSGSARLAPALEEAWRRCSGCPQRDRFDPEPIVLEACLDKSPDAVLSARAKSAVASDDLDEVMHLLTPAITAQAIARQREHLLMLHACAVASPTTGAAVALVAPSGMGKTTAAIALSRVFGYVSDETVALRDDNSLVDYPKPLSICPTDERPVKAQVSPDELGLAVAPARPRLAALLMLDRGPSAPAQPVLERVPALYALAALAPQVSFLASRPKPLHRLADLLDAAGGLLRVRYREAAQLLPVVGELLEATR